MNCVQTLCSQHTHTGWTDELCTNVVQWTHSHWMHWWSVYKRCAVNTLALYAPMNCVQTLCSEHTRTRCTDDLCTLPLDALMNCVQTLCSEHTRTRCTDELCKNVVQSTHSHWMHWWSVYKCCAVNILALDAPMNCVQTLCSQHTRTKCTDKLWTTHSHWMHRWSVYECCAVNTLALDALMICVQTLCSEHTRTGCTDELCTKVVQWTHSH